MAACSSGGTWELWRTVVRLGREAASSTSTSPSSPTAAATRTYNYVQIVCFAALAAVAALVWTLLDRRRARLHAAVRVAPGLRPLLARHGDDPVRRRKIIQSQFPTPSLDRLLQPFGDASPMGLLWTFMGASAAYTIFAGVAEMLGGLLLIVRRTTLLGALVSIGVDEPTWSCSTSATTCRSSCTRRTCSPWRSSWPLPTCGGSPTCSCSTARWSRPRHRPLFARTWLHRGALVCRTVFLVGSRHPAWSMQIYGRYKTYGARPKSPLYGIWNVDEFVIDGQVRPPLVTDAPAGAGWSSITPSMIAIQRMSDTRAALHSAAGCGRRRTLALTKRDDPAWKSTLTYQRPSPGGSCWTGTFDGKKIQAVLRRTENARVPAHQPGLPLDQRIPVQPLGTRSGLIRGASALPTASWPAAFQWVSSG